MTYYVRAVIVSVLIACAVAIFSSTAEVKNAGTFLLVSKANGLVFNFNLKLAGGQYQCKSMPKARGKQDERDSEASSQYVGGSPYGGNFGAIQIGALGDTYGQLISSSQCNQWTSVTSSSINSSFTGVCIFNACGSDGVYCPEKRSFIGRIVIPRYTTTTVLDTATLTPLCLPSPTTKVNIPLVPTASPTISMLPTRNPTTRPTYNPSTPPTYKPSAPPSVKPTPQPTTNPSFRPTTGPSSKPTYVPTSPPSFKPTIQPSNRPTSQTTVNPTSQPTNSPNQESTINPSSELTISPTSQSTGSPTSTSTALPQCVPKTNACVVDVGVTVLFYRIDV